MIRALDIFIASIALIVLLPISLISLLACWIETGSPVVSQKRLGLRKKEFSMLKFRTMKLEAALAPTHLADTSEITITGKYLRKTKIDEFPQFWNVIKGEMTIVGPRPCLPMQLELIKARETLNIFDAKPGITGLAQVKGIDMSDPKKLTEMDAEMIANLNLRSYFRYIFETIRLTQSKGQ